MSPNQLGYLLTSFAGHGTVWRAAAQGVVCPMDGSANTYEKCNGRVLGVIGQPTVCWVIQ